MKLILLFKRLFGMIKYNKELIGPNSHPIIAPPVPNRKVIREVVVEPTRNSLEKTYTQSEMEDLINKISEEISIELETKHKEEVSRLNAKLDAKDAMLMELTKQVNEILTRGGGSIDRTELTNLSIDVDTIFIDPSVRGAENKMQNHIVVEEVKGEGSNVKDSVNKLKNLLGKKDRL